MTAYWLEYRGVAHPLLRRETLLGRGEECTIYVPHAQVSRIHAAVRLTRKGVELLDLGSMNGTRLNGEKLHRPQHMKDGDAIRIGAEELVLRIDSSRRWWGRRRPRAYQQVIALHKQRLMAPMEWK